MFINIHNPKRVEVDVLRGDKQTQTFATVRYASPTGGVITMYFNSPDDLRNEATALKLLAEKLEEEQAK